MLDIKGKSLFELLVPPDNYNFSCAVAAAYSAKDSVINELIKSFGFSYDVKKIDEAFNDKKLMIFYQQGEYYGKNDILYPQNDPETNGTFHPKLWCVKYSNSENGHIYRVIVSSCNLTNENNLDCYICFDGCISDSETAFGKSVSDFFAQLDYEGAEGSLSILKEEIKKADFGNGAGFLIHGKTMKEKMITDANNSEKAIIISPFIDKDTVETLLGNTQEKYLISREDQLAETGKINGVKTYIFSPQSRDIADKSLHAKVYMYFQENKTVIYLGSANCTKAAFNNNKEILVRIEQDKIEDGKIKEFLSYFIEYENEDNKNESDSKEQKAIDLLCREIKNKFTYEKTDNGFKYKIEFSSKRAGIEVFIDGIKLELIDGIYYESNKKNTHNITVRVSLGEKIKEISFLIKGVPNRFESKGYVENNIFDMLKISSPSASKENMKENNIKEKLNIQSLGKYEPAKRIELIYDIDNENDAKIMLGKIEELLKKLSDSSEVKDILKNAKIALERLYSGGRNCGEE